jgi:hypothetical protein
VTGHEVANIIAAQSKRELRLPLSGRYGLVGPAR